MASPAWPAWPRWRTRSPSATPRGMTVAFALLAALGNAVNVITQHIASTSDPQRSTGWRLVVYLFKNPLWLLGWVALLGAFVFQALALHAGQLSVVQTLLDHRAGLRALAAAHLDPAGHQRLGVGLRRARPRRPSPSSSPWPSLEAAISRRPRAPGSPRSSGAAWRRRSPDCWPCGARPPVGRRCWPPPRGWSGPSRPPSSSP